MRDKLSRSKSFITILISLEILAGLILLCIATYFHWILIDYLPKTERQMLLSQMSNIYLVGFEVLICFSLGLVLWQHCQCEQPKLLIVWNSFCTLAVVCGSITVWFQYYNIQSLQKTYAASLFQGIDLYFTDPEWKLLWDGIQFNKECCGVFGFKDWEEAVWIPQEEEEECQQSLDARPSIVMIPYACCKHSATSCFQSFAPQSKNDENLYKDLSDINVSGCFLKFKNLTFQFSDIVCSIWVFCFIIHSLLLVFNFCLISRSNKISFNSLIDPDECCERPLVVVKCPRSVRCITLTDEDTCGDEQEADKGNIHECSNCIMEGISIHQEIFDNCNEKQNLFIH